MPERDWDAHYAALRIDPEKMTVDQFFALPEYSCSRPTGVFYGKQWRDNLTAFADPKLALPPKWVIREYVPHPTDPGMARTVTTPWPIGAAS